MPCILLLNEAFVWMLQYVVDENGFREIGVRECAGENVGLELLGEETLHPLVHELLEEPIEQEEWLPDIDTHLNRSLDESSLLRLKVVKNFVLWVSSYHGHTQLVYPRFIRMATVVKNSLMI